MVEFFVGRAKGAQFDAAHAVVGAPSGFVFGRLAGNEAELKRNFHELPLTEGENSKNVWRVFFVRAR